jgi:nitrate/TMAO reductase-like tetraheme cytochrome c subunit
MASYGAPALMKGAYSYPTPVNAAGVPYLLCTTCHNQHKMNIYAASSTSPIAGNTAGTYATYFFINGPYNINNVTVPPTSATSTSQFCRQCHFGDSNEANGGTLPTAF